MSVRVTYLVHILAGSLGIVSGFVALYATKGAPLHRRIGMVFVCAMLTTALLGVTIAAVRGVAPAVNIPAVCFALFIAALSFFIGQSKVFPKPIRIVGVSATEASFSSSLV
jgi:uncharacterized membrane protein